ncbi:MAG TPA: iron export ABC transporter permease subunit FetB [Candidatus Methanofastidiosa archaeon]|nr:iron export ABC transporter permease subunit FetB [Candidatus Methanofastidiosa archaeon]
MTSQIVDISLLRMMASYGFVLVVLALIRLKRIGLGRDLVTAVIRMTVQLIVMAFILEMIFDMSLWYVVIAMEMAIFILASRIVLSRVKAKTRNLSRNILISLLLGAGSIMAFFIVIIVGPDPLYDPRYVIPLGGMIIGNSMNACAIAFERFHSLMKKDRKLILTLLSLGATSTEATSSQFKEALKAAFLPILITMTATGMVILPGMMTGQILSGTSPLTAVKYQIAIMMGITSSNALVAYLILYLENGEFFNNKHQFLLSAD